MKKNLIFILTFLAVTAGMLSCAEKDLPTDPVRQYPVKTLILTVGERDYLAVPKVDPDKQFNDTLVVNVAEGQPTATVKKLVLANPSDAINIAEGQELTFTKDRFTVILNEGKANEHKYCIDMVYEKPDPLPAGIFVVHTGTKDPDGASYWLDPDNRDKYLQLMPTEAKKTLYEGHVYLGDTDWVNLSFVNSDLVTYYNKIASESFAGTSGTLTLDQNEYTGETNCYPSNGIWGDWAAGSGVWMLCLDTETLEFKALCTQWALAGAAVGAAPKSLTYNVDSKVWSAAVELTAGAFKFTTVPVNAADPTITYGASGAGKGLLEGGADITVAEAGNYTVTLNLATPLAYTYSIVKEGDPEPEPEPDPLPLMYLTNTKISGPDGKCYIDPSKLDDRNLYPALASADGGVVFEGFVYYKDYSWENISFVHSDLKKYYSSGGGLNGAETSKTLDIVEKIPVAPNYFPVDGPWGDWALGAGVWMFSIDTKTRQLTALCTAWAITGGVVADTPAAMTFSVADRKWTLKASLAAGTLRFTTIPVSEGDPVLTYGQKADKAGVLVSGGADIEVAEGGEYTITLDLSKPAQYSYSLVK